MFFKKKIDKANYVKVLLTHVGKIFDFIWEEFKKEFEIQDDPPTKKTIETVKEIWIFSLWLTTVSIPSEKEELRDILQDAFLKTKGKAIFKDKDTDEKFAEIGIRYRKYFKAYNLWQNEPQNGHMMGAAMIKTIINNNQKFSLDQGIPEVSAFDAMKAFSIFSEAFILLLELKEKFNKVYKVIN